MIMTCRPGESAWIMKEGNGARGMGLSIVRGKALAKQVQDFGHQGVAQRCDPHVSPPLPFGANGAITASGLCARARDRYEPHAELSAELPMLSIRARTRAMP